jgi:DNA-binding GntR family transcriptional regulator
MENIAGDKIPPWLLFYEALRKGIISGKVQPEYPLSFQELRQNVNLNLSLEEEHQAINFLIAEGLIKQQHNRLTFSAPPARSRRDTGFIEDHLASGHKPSVRTLRLEVFPTSQICPEARVYLPNTEELWIRHYHVQLIDNIPYALADSYIPHQEFTSLIPFLRNTTVDLYKLMANLGYHATKKEERLFIDMPTLEEREYLEILELMRVQVMRLDTRVWSDESLIEVCILCDRADLYEFNYTVDMHI